MFDSTFSTIHEAALLVSVVTHLPNLFALIKKFFTLIKKLFNQEQEVEALVKKDIAEDVPEAQEIINEIKQLKSNAN